MLPPLLDGYTACRRKDGQAEEVGSAGAPGYVGD